MKCETFSKFWNERLIWCRKVQIYETFILYQFVTIWLWLSWTCGISAVIFNSECGRCGKLKMHPYISKMIHVSVCFYLSFHRVTIFTKPKDQIHRFCRKIWRRKNQKHLVKHFPENEMFSVSPMNGEREEAPISLETKKKNRKTPFLIHIKRYQKTKDRPEKKVKTKMKIINARATRESNGDYKSLICKRLQTDFVPRCRSFVTGSPAAIV